MPAIRGTDRLEGAGKTIDLMVELKRSLERTGRQRGALQAIQLLEQYLDLEQSRRPRYPQLTLSSLREVDDLEQELDAIRGRRDEPAAVYLGRREVVLAIKDWADEATIRQPAGPGFERLYFNLEELAFRLVELRTEWGLPAT